MNSLKDQSEDDIDQAKKKEFVMYLCNEEIDFIKNNFKKEVLLGEDLKNIGKISIEKARAISDISVKYYNKRNISQIEFID